jgi:hypothetical protein
MSACIVLDDGRALWRSSFATSGLLHLIALQLPDEHRDLGTWLEDKGSRPTPFIDFDIRGLSPVHRGAFYAAARRAMDELLRKNPQAVEQGHAAEALDRLLRMKERIDRGEPPLSLSDDDKIHPFDGQAIDLSEIWALEATGESSGLDTAGFAPSIAVRIGMVLFVGACAATGVCAGLYFGHREVSLLELSCFIGVTATLASGATAWVLFRPGRA